MELFEAARTEYNKSKETNDQWRKDKKQLQCNRQI
jgi:hypothetical protein